MRPSALLMCMWTFASPRRKDPTVSIRIKADDLHRFALEYEPNFGFFVKLRGVREPVAFIENVKRRVFRCRIDEEWEGLTNIDAESR
jgi:hypothetical protein